MKLFELKTAILVVVILIIARIILMTYILPYISIDYGLHQAMLFNASINLVLLLIAICYFFAYLLKWNKGEAKFF